MPAVRARRSARHSAGLPKALRQMWTRLYSEDPARSAPWIDQGPFPPLVRAVQDGWLIPPSSILDVGCGVGTNTYWLAAQGFRATGIDVAPGAIAAAESKRGSAASNPHFLVDDVLDCRLAPGRYDAAIDVGCFQTLPPRYRHD